jgi:hypothetical protein
VGVATLAATASPLPPARLGIARGGSGFSPPAPNRAHVARTDTWEWFAVPLTANRAHGLPARAVGAVGGEEMPSCV